MEILGQLLIHLAKHLIFLNQFSNLMCNFIGIKALIYGANSRTSEIQDSKGGPFRTVRYLQCKSCTAPPWLTLWPGPVVTRLRRREEPLVKPVVCSVVCYNQKQQLSSCVKESILLSLFTPQKCQVSYLNAITCQYSQKWQFQTHIGIKMFILSDG